MCWTLCVRCPLWVFLGKKSSSRAVISSEYCGKTGVGNFCSLPFRGGGNKRGVSGGFISNSCSCTSRRCVGAACVPSGTCTSGIRCSSFLSCKRPAKKSNLPLIAERRGYGQLLRRSHRHSCETLPAIHQIVDVQHEIGCDTGVSMNMRHRVE